MDNEVLKSAFDAIDDLNLNQKDKNSNQQRVKSRMDTSLPCATEQSHDIKLAASFSTLLTAFACTKSEALLQKICNSVGLRAALHDLLHNDCLIDWIRRKDVYEPLLSLIRGLIKYPFECCELFVSDFSPIQRESTSDGNAACPRGQSVLVSRLKSLSHQANLFLGLHSSAMETNANMASFQPGGQPSSTLQADGGGGGGAGGDRRNDSRKLWNSSGGTGSSTVEARSRARATIKRFRAAARLLDDKPRTSPIRRPRSTRARLAAAEAEAEAHRLTAKIGKEVLDCWPTAPALDDRRLPAGCPHAAETRAVAGASGGASSGQSAGSTVVVADAALKEAFTSSAGAGGSVSLPVLAPASAASGHGRRGLVFSWDWLAGEVPQEESEDEICWAMPVWEGRGEAVDGGERGELAAAQGGGARRGSGGAGLSGGVFSDDKPRFVDLSTEGGPFQNGSGGAESAMAPASKKARLAAAGGAWVMEELFGAEESTPAPTSGKLDDKMDTEIGKSMKLAVSPMYDAWNSFDPSSDSELWSFGASKWRPEEADPPAVEDLAEAGHEICLAIQSTYRQVCEAWDSLERGGTLASSSVVAPGTPAGPGPEAAGPRDSPHPGGTLAADALPAAQGLEAAQASAATAAAALESPPKPPPASLLPGPAPCPPRPYLETDGSGAEAEGAAAAEGGARSRAAEEEEGYLGALGPLRFAAVDLAGRHTLASKPRGPAPLGRMARLAAELASLAGSLPVHRSSSIFVRADESRPHLLKALIVGPENTPYANGLFEFDMLLPCSYPHTPPEVRLVTTGGGRVRFNPNLYANGIVCLSLLGTWHGPGWSPGKSSVLQVLVSIQAMVLVAEPYYNEPAMSDMGCPRLRRQSETYNRTVRQNTLRWAVLEQLRHPPAAFADVARAHFRLKRDALLRQIEEWERVDAQAPQYERALGQLFSDEAVDATGCAKAACAELAKLPPWPDSAHVSG